MGATAPTYHMKGHDMPRIRTIKPEFFEDEKVGRLPLSGRLLFIRLWTLADDDGIARGNPSYLRNQTFPYDDDITVGDVATLMSQLTDLGMVEVYKHECEIYTRIIHFTRHQRINRPSKKKNPKPVADQPVETLTEIIPTLTEIKPRIGKGKGKGKGNIYTSQFTEFWNWMLSIAGAPRRQGKRVVFKNYTETLEPQWRKAVENYAAHNQHNNTPDRYIMQAQTFFGPSARWEDWLEPMPTVPDHHLADLDAEGWS